MHHWIRQGEDQDDGYGVRYDEYEYIRQSGHIADKSTGPSRARPFAIPGLRAVWFCPTCPYWVYLRRLSLGPVRRIYWNNIDQLRDDVALD